MLLPSRVTIAGVGLIGGSLGLALKSMPGAPEVVGWGRSEDSLRAAQERGAIDRYSTDLAEACAGSDLFVICTPVRTIVPVALAASPLMSPGSMITDAGSTKSEVVATLDAAMSPGVTFIGGHPMAGSEVTGISGATPHLFVGAPWVLTPTGSTDSSAYGLLHGLLSKIGARVMSLSPATHDHMVSMISHMPHMVSAALVDAVAREEDEAARSNLLTLAAGGFRDMTRIAASSPEVWLDICMTNADAIVRSIERLCASLDDISQAIQARDEDRIRKILTDTAELRRNLPGTVERAEGRVRLRIPVEDRPGVISTAAMVVGEKGVNIVDLELLRMTDGTAVLELFFSDIESARKADAALSGVGFSSQLLGGI